MGSREDNGSDNSGSDWLDPQAVEEHDKKFDDEHGTGQERKRDKGFWRTALRPSLWLTRLAERSRTRRRFLLGMTG